MKEKRTSTSEPNWSNRRKLYSFLSSRQNKILWHDAHRQFIVNLTIIEILFLGELESLNGTPLQYSCLENPMDEGAWWAAVHGVARSRTRLSDFTFTFHFHVLEKEMATHSSVLAWRIAGTGEPGRLLSVGSHRVGHDWSNLAAAAIYDIWKSHF